VSGVARGTEKLGPIEGNRSVPGRVCFGILPKARRECSHTATRPSISYSQHLSGLAFLRSDAIWRCLTKITSDRPTPSVVHSSLYLPEGVHEALREAAFHERCKIHDIIMQGIDAALRKRGYPPVEDLKAGKKQ
jgi:hypothetical protein